ncbi:MAG TPA: universal stress protein [Acidobacteriota bacterium]|nr:universal stress protein [Acidobacteriota bacterium]
MKQLSRILVPTDLADNSRRALSYGCWLAGEENAALIVLHVASEMSAWEFYSEDALVAGIDTKPWPLDRVLAEATLDLNRFLEPHMSSLKQLRNVTKRVLLGPIAQQINSVAAEEKADLVIMSPRRNRGLRHWLSGGITDRVTRLSPCPVLSIAPPLPSQPWRKKYPPLIFGWPRQSTVNL